MFMISETTCRVLAMAALGTDALIDELLVRDARRLGPLRRFDRTSPTLGVASATGVSRIRLDGRRVLLDLDFHGIRYSEAGPEACELVVPGALPAPAWTAVAGRSIGDLVDLGQATPTLGPLTVAARIEVWSGAVGFAVVPAWIGVPDPP